MSWLSGVTGVIGEDSTDEVSVDELGELIKSESMCEKSRSLREAFHDPVGDIKVLMSGAVSAWTFVVEMSSVGSEIRFRSIVPAGYFTVAVREGVDVVLLRPFRFVNARASDAMVG